MKSITYSSEHSRMPSTRLTRGAKRLSMLLTLASSTAFAQFSGTLEGTVKDNTGAEISGASLSVKNTDTGIASKVVTNGSGQYRVNSLAPGRYLIDVTSPGFQAKEVEASVTTSQNAGVDIVLGIATATQVVEVSSEGGGGLNTEETRVQTTLDTQQVRDLPLQNRGTLSLVNAAPGVSGYSENTNNFAVEQTPSASANGHYFGGNLYVLDGISITSNITTGTANISPNADSLQEVSLQVNTFTMDFPSGAGLTTSVTTKAGANQFHGTGNFTYTDQRLRAHAYFQRSALPTISNKDVSATFGGPIIRDRTFFFASVEKLNNKTATTNLFSVEDPAFINYAQQAFPNTIGTSLLKRFPFVNGARSGVQLYGTPDFLTTCATPSGACNVPFIDGASSTVSPAQRGLQYSVRGDQYFRGGRDRVYGYYYNINFSQQAIDPRLNLSNTNNSNSYFANANYTHTFSPNLLNEAQFAAYKVFGANNTADPSLPLIHINNAESVTGFGGGWGPGSFIQHNYSWRDVVSYVRGNHNFSFGAQVEHGDDSADFGGPQARPNFGFNSLTDFIQDKVYDESNVSIDPLTGNFKPLQFGVQATAYGGYVQDVWKAASNLTLTLGVRWDDFGNPRTYGYSTYTQIANVIIGPTTSPDFTNLNTQFANASIQQTHNIYPASQNKNFTPRAAFAWRPYKGNENISVHGGIGLYRDPITLGQVVDGLRGNPPGWIFPTFSPTQPIQPLYSFGNSQTLPYGFVYPKVPSTGLDAHGGVIGAGAGVTGIDPNVRIPKTLNYTLGVSTEIAKHMVLGVNGVGSHAYDQLSGTDFNRVAGDLIRNNGKLVRLNPSFSSIGYVSNLNTANYFGLVTTLTQRIGQVNYQASYTWSRSTDYGTCNTRFDFSGNLDCPPDQHNFAGNYGPSSFDVRNVFKVSGSYTVPSPHLEAIADHLLGGWEIASIATAQSGTPFTAVNLNNYDATCTGQVVTCGDYNADGYNVDRPNLGLAFRPTNFSRANYIQGVFPRATQTYSGKGYSVPTSFTAPTAGTLGNESRNMFRNPGLLAIDASLLKNNSIHWFGQEKANLQIRMDFFNVLNRVNLTGVDYNVGSNTFGQSLNTLQPRVMQAGARFQF